MMVRKGISFVFALIFMLCFTPKLFAEEVIITLSTNEVVSFDLGNSPRITYEGGMIKVVGGEKTFTADLAYVANYKFVKNANSVDKMQNEASHEVYQDKVVFKGLEPASAVAVFDTTGKLIKKSKADQSGALTIALDELPKGIYIFKTSKSSFKLSR